MGEKWNAMREPFSLEEWTGQRARDSAGMRVDLPGLDAGSAPVGQRAEDRPGQSMADIHDTISGFDPLKGLLAIRPGNMAGDSQSIIPKAPAGVSLERNIERAEAMRDANRMAPLTPGSFSPHNIGREMFKLFSDGGEMDYKRGGRSEYRDFGNFNYGAFGSAYGFSPYELHTGAGIQQMRDGRWEPSYGVPFLSGRLGDNKEDYDQIERGIDCYKNRKVP